MVLGIGLYLAQTTEQLIQNNDSAQSARLGLVARVGILFLFTAMGLRQMGIAPEIISLAFTCILGSVCIAAAIAFGVGGRAVAGQLLEEWVKNPGQPGR